MATVKESFEQLHKEYEKHASQGNIPAVYELIPSIEALLNDSPNSPEIMFTLATAKMICGSEGLAIALLERLMMQIEDAPEILNNLGTCWKRLNKDENAQACWEQALKLRGNDPDLWNNLATLHINIGTPREGMKYVLEGFKLDPNMSRLHWNHSLLRLEMGQWEKGFEDYEAGLFSGDRSIKPYHKDPEKVPLWDGEEGRVVVYGEQGMGDEIMYASAIPDAIHHFGKDGIIFDCHPRLEGIFKRAFPGIPIYPNRKMVNAVPDWAEKEKPDYKLPLASLFRLFRSQGQFPRLKYLSPDKELVAFYENKLKETGDGPYIGIGWKAGYRSTRDDLRSLKLGWFRPVIEKGGTFISLQYSAGSAGKCQRFKEDSGIEVHHWEDVVEATKPDGERYTGFNYDHTMALIAALDLVIVPNTTAVHTCGAIGHECWTLTPDGPAWRYQLEGEDMFQYGPWIRQIRQNGRPWTEVLEVVGREYEGLLSGARTESAEAASGG